jgi:hypothetical protein
LVYPDSWLEASSGIQPQLEHLVVVEAECTVALVEEDLETMEVVDLRTEGLLEHWLLVEFWLGQDVESELIY